MERREEERVLSLSHDLGVVATAKQLQMVCFRFPLWQFGGFLHLFVCSEQKSSAELNQPDQVYVDAKDRVSTPS